MGCDIHCFLLKEEENGTLKEYALYNKIEKGADIFFEKAYVAEERSYPLFSKLADVRGYEKEIDCGTYGFIPGCPEYIIDIYNNDYYHTPKYFNYKELMKCAKIEGMTEFLDDYGAENYNIVEEWLNEFNIIRYSYGLYDKDNLYIQIFFDN